MEKAQVTYTIVLEPSEDGGWSAYAPDLPGLLLAADSREKLIETASAAIADYLDATRECGLEPGKPGELIANIVVRL